MILPKTEPVPSPADVILRDGSNLRLRPPTPADRDALVTFLVALSPASMAMRHHAAVQP